MLSTIKAKIFLIVGLTLLALMFALSVFSFVYFQNSKPYFVDAYYRSISALIYDIDRDIMKVEDSARDMAIYGEMFYKLHNKQGVLEQFVLKIIADYREALSGGIWFEPYSIDANKERFCAFAYLNSNNQTVLNSNYMSEEYSYLKSEWYRDIFDQIKGGKKVAWSKPYYETNGNTTYMITAGVGVYDGDKLVGISTADWEIESIIDDVSHLQPTPNSFLLFADSKNDFIMVSTDKYLDNNNLFGESLSSIPWYSSEMKDVTSFKYHDKRYIPYIKKMDNGMLLIVNIPEYEMFSRILFRFVGLFSILILFSILLGFALYYALKNNIIKPINKLTELANEIESGATDLTIKIEKPAEFAHLAQSFDKMKVELQDITQKQSVMESELSIATAIQYASLPSVFPAYPDRDEFYIYASMNAAKEVGGDFYDFYFINSNQFMFLIADVSGKGVPAALFMMTVKTLISNMYQFQYSEKELIEAINKKVCEGNKEGFFVTLFAAIIDINTGEISYINCGHPQPLLKTAHGTYEYLDTPYNIVLGAFPNADYKIQKGYMNPGDRLFFYTDGITEAFNKSEEQFGEERLRAVLNENSGLSVFDTPSCVNAAIKEFADGAHQSDDITMLVFEYKGVAKEKVFKDIAIQENYKKFYPMLYQCTSAWKINDALANKIYMCAEEMFANVVFHAYPDEPGMLEAICKLDNDEVILSFIDEGIPYNPLEKPDPDISLPPSKRPIGGLGIFMIKKMADRMEYERKDNKNIFTVSFKKVVS